MKANEEPNLSYDSIDPTSLTPHARFIWNQLCAHSVRFDKESESHKALHRRLRYCAFGLSGVSTVFAGIALRGGVAQSLIDVLVLLFTASIGVVTSIEGVRKPAELWIHERTTYYSLEDLKREFALEYYHDNRPSEFDELFERMQTLLGASGDKWSRQIVARNDNANTSQG